MEQEDKVLWFGRATSADDFDQVFRLNHRTFAEEIPQYDVQDDGRLVDKFHVENDYLICKDGAEVIGMIALRARRPFSLDSKLPDLDRYLPPNRSLCEIRLLAVLHQRRYGRVLPGLVRELVSLCRERGHDYAVISATTRQTKLYEHFGFVAFGPVTGKPGAFYQPMAISLEAFSKSVSWLADPNVNAAKPPICLLPGPVEIHPDVLSAAAKPPKSHRSAAVTMAMAECQRRMLKLVRADKMQILLGSGTLANDTIAQQLRLLGGRGLILTNGEFGNRLIDHARRAGLDFIVSRVPCGEPFDYLATKRRVLIHRPVRWMWMVHCETSTGVLNDIEGFTALAQTFGAEAALDCISSIGNVSLDLGGIAYASAVSGKGLASLPGLAFVFHRSGALKSGIGLPRYLDLAFYAQNRSIPFTHSSNLLQALLAALSLQANNEERRAAIARAVWAVAAERGLAPVARETDAAPFVITIAIPPHLDSGNVGAEMLKRGYQIAYESAYLKELNWVQIAWMGLVDGGDVVAACEALAEIINQPGRHLAASASNVIGLIASQ